jgi:hypothetical protein
MDAFNTIMLLRCFFFTKVSVVFGILCSCFTNPLLGQIFLEEQTYQSNVAIGSVGNWDDPASWQIWEGGVWAAATVPPNRNNDVFIHQNHEIRLTRNEEVRNLYLFSAANPGRKLNLQIFDLDVYGSFRCFRMQDGNFILNSLTNALTNWIYPETGSIVFRGKSRTIVDWESWSGQTFNSSYTVRFNPEAGETLTVDAAIKASRFIIESGTVFQTVNQNGEAASSTFSFNTHSSFGTGPYGSLVIRSGARLISETTREFRQIIRRSNTLPAAEFILEEGAILELWGDEPVIDAASVILEGEVRYHSNQPTQKFLSHTFGGSQPIIAYNDLHITGSAIRPLPAVLEVYGDFSVNDGALEDNETVLYLLGSMDQVVDLAILPLSVIEINKTGGRLTFKQALQLTGDFTMRSGMVDFNHQTLHLNGSPTANYTFINGAWANLAALTLSYLPVDWTAGNATFPFFDSYAGENRYLRIQGSLSNQTGTLTIQFMEMPGVNYQANLIDFDGKTIYYHLNSHFLINTSSLATENFMIQILANDMVLDDIDDLRLSGYGEISPGIPVPTAWEGGNLWGNRSVSLGELNGQTLTLGSSGILSVLPLRWKRYDAYIRDNRVQITWKVKAEVGTSFILKRSLGSDMFFTTIGTVESIYNFTEYHAYNYDDPLPIGEDSEWIYYQIQSVLNGQLIDQSTVFRVRNPKISAPARIYPNPYRSGNLVFTASTQSWSDNAHIQVIDSKGSVWIDNTSLFRDNLHYFEDRLKNLPPGMYIIRLFSEEGSQQIKWIRE